MKRVVFVLCWGLFWSADAGFSAKKSIVGGSGASSSMRRGVPVGESSTSGSNLSRAVGEITSRVGSLSCGDDSSSHSGGGASDWYYLSGMDGVRLILDQSNTRLVVAQQEARSLHEKVNEDQQKINEQSRIISEQTRGAERDKAVIRTLEEKDVVNQQEIDIQKKVISKQAEDLNDREQEVLSLKRKAECLEEQVEEKNRQIIARDRKFSIVEQEFEKKLLNVVCERDRYKKENEGFKNSLNTMLQAMDDYVKSWSSEEDFVRQYGYAKDPREKMVIVMTHLLSQGARKEGVSQDTSILQVSSREYQENLSLNTIVDATRHEFLIKSERDGPVFRMGNYEYRGGVDENNTPNGEGEISDDRMKIKGTFKEGFLDISNDVTFEYNGYSCTFRFPNKKLRDEYFKLISFTDISEIKCFFDLSKKRLVFRQSDKEVSFIFSENYVYVGSLGENNYPNGRGVRFSKDGQIRDGKFKNGFFQSSENNVNQPPGNNVKRKRTM